MNEVQKDRSDVFDRYLISHIDKSKANKIQSAQLELLKTAHQKLGINKREKRIKQKNLGEYEKETENQNNIVTFSCKDLNHMLVAIYLIFVKGRNNNELFDMIEHQEMSSTCQSKSSNQAKSKKLCEVSDIQAISAIKKLKYIFKNSPESQLYKKANLVSINNLGFYQNKHPLYTSYNLRTNLVHVNSSLILELISALENKFEDLTHKLQEMIIGCLKEIKKNGEFQSNLREKRENRQFYFIKFKQNSLTEQIIILVPQQNENQKNSRIPYKLILFPNQEVFTKYIEKMGKLLKQREQENNQNPQNTDDSPQSLMPNQIQSTIRTQNQQTETTGKKLSKKVSQTKKWFNKKNKRLSHAVDGLVSVSSQFVNALLSASSQFVDVCVGVFAVIFGLLTVVAAVFLAVNLRMEVNQMMIEQISQLRMKFKYQIEFLDEIINVIEPFINEIFTKLLTHMVSYLKLVIYGIILYQLSLQQSRNVKLSKNQKVFLQHLHKILISAFCLILLIKFIFL